MFLRKKNYLKLPESKYPYKDMVSSFKKLEKQLNLKKNKITKIRKNVYFPLVFISQHLWGVNQSSALHWELSQEPLPCARLMSSCFV